MDEWTVVTVLSALIGLFFIIYTPLSNRQKERLEEHKEAEKERIQQLKAAVEAREANTQAITELNTTVKFFVEHFRQVEEENRQSHKSIYERLNSKSKTLATHEEKLRDHEERIKKLEEED